MNLTKINVIVKSNDKYLYHTTINITKNRLAEMLEDTNNCEQYLQEALKFIKYFDKKENVKSKITDFLILYDENGKEKMIDCNYFLLSDSVENYYNE